MKQKPIDIKAEHRVSVVLPTYNRGWIIGQAVDSVLDQDYKNLELVVVDDGSIDDTPQLLSAFGDRLRIIRQENQGVSAARNAGIRAATGELIALLDELGSGALSHAQRETLDTLRDGIALLAR